MFLYFFLKIPTRAAWERKTELIYCYYNINNIVLYPFAITAAPFEFIMRSVVAIVCDDLYFRNLGEPRRVFRSACGRRISN